MNSTPIMYLENTAGRSLPTSTSTRWESVISKLIELDAPDRPEHDFRHERDYLDVETARDCDRKTDFSMTNTENVHLLSIVLRIR